MRDFHLPGRGPAYGTSGMAATSMPAATLTALDVLRAGGNAMDAAIAAVAVLGVIEPQSTGIGGDCFCLYAPAGQRRVLALNGSGQAPDGATIDFFESQGITALDSTSPHAVTVPGAVSAWEALLAAHGTKGLDELLQPAIRFAAEGWPVHPRVAHDWHVAGDKLRLTGAAPFLPGGHTPAPGDRFVQPQLAETLRAIARSGAAAFYEGAIAADIVAALRSRGGLHTEADFARGRTAAHAVEPIHTSWRGYEVWQCPPNGSGLAVLMQLGILGGWDAAPDGPLGITRLHRHLEAARLVYRDRDAFLADPLQTEVPVARLLDPAYLAALRGLIRDDVALRDLPRAGEAALPRHRDTVTLSVVDRDGNACSLINSLFESFGSGILAERSGVMLHNRGLGFRIARGHPNCIAPRQAADAHHHSGHGDQGWRGGDGLWRHGRAFPADGPDAVPDQPYRLRAGHSGGDRPAARDGDRRQGGSGTGHLAVADRPAVTARPSGGPRRPPAWRRAGNSHRPRARRADRRLRSTQGRDGARVLNVKRPAHVATGQGLVSRSG